MMAKLAYALGGKTIGAAKSASEDRVRKLEHSVIATQQLSRQVLRRLDDARKDETRVAVSTAKAQRTLVASLDQLVARLDELMEEGEIIAKSRIDDVSTAIDEVKAQMDVSIDRLEGHIAANRQETAKVQATAQTAAQETVKLARFIDERLVKTAGAR
jgi:multidrug resistance efflux pump